MKLKEFATINMGQSPKGETYNTYGNGMPFLQGRKTFGRIFPNIDTWTTNPIKIANKDEILMSVRAPVGDMNFANQRICIGRGLCSINAKNGKNKYLYYMLLNSINELKQKSTGTVFDSINRNDLENLDINFHTEEEQDKIERILGSIDSKIELNNEINNNMYELAINYLNSKIEEYEVPVSNFAKIQGGYAFKSKDLLDTYTNNRIIKIKNLRSEISADVINSQFVDDDVVEKIDNKFKLTKGDVAIAMTGAELGKTGFIYGFDNYFLNQRVGVIKGKSKESELYLKILFLSEEFQTLLNSKGYGSAQPNISTTDIENILINNVSEDNLKNLYDKLNPIYNKIISNSEENLNLEQLRDTLLQKLMNGEIDLGNIEI